MPKKKTKLVSVVKKKRRSGTHAELFQQRMKMRRGEVDPGG